MLRESDGYELKNIDKQPSHFFSDVTVTGDVRDREKLTELLKGTDVVVLLAAEHRDDASPLSLYYEVNVGGMQNALAVMEANGIKRIVFTSSVAVYGLNKKNPKIPSIITGRTNGLRRWTGKMAQASSGLEYQYLASDSDFRGEEPGECV